jgi:hypothetical protein
VLQEKWVTVNKIKRLGEREAPINELIVATIKKIGRERDPEEIREIIVDELDIYE